MTIKGRLSRMTAMMLSLLLVLTMLFATVVPAAAYSTNGNYTGYFRLSIGGSFQNVAYVNVPCGGNTVSASYVWNPSKYCFELRVTEGEEYVPFTVSYTTVNNADVSKVSWSYTSPKTGNGSFSQKTQYATALTASDKTVTVNLVAGSKVVGNVSTVLSATVFGRYLVKAADLEKEITAKLTDLGYDPTVFSFAQQAYTEFTYKGCTAVNFTFDGTKLDPNPGSGTEQPGGDDKDDEKTCLLKVYGVEYGVTAESPTYNNPYTTYIQPGYNYRILTPESYGIFPKEGYEFDYWFSTVKRESNTDVYIPYGSSGWSIVAYYKQIQVEDSVFTVQLVDGDGNVLHTYTESYSGQYYDQVTILPDEAELPEYYVYAGNQQYTGIVGKPETVQFRVEKLPTYALSIAKNADFVTASGFGEDGAVVEGEEYILLTSDSVSLEAIDGYKISKLYIKDQTTRKVVVNTTGQWKSIELTSLFTPMKDHKYTISLLVEKVSYKVSFSKNAEHVIAYGIGDRRTVKNNVEYAVPVDEGFLLVPEMGYRITKVLVKDVQTGEQLFVIEPNDPDYVFKFTEAVTPEEGKRYVVHFNVEASSYTVRFTKNSSLFTVDGIDATLTDGTSYTISLWDSMTLRTKDAGQAFTKIYIKDVTTGKVVLQKTNLGHTVSLATYGFTPEKDHVYSISVLIG